MASGPRLIDFAMSFANSSPFCKHDAEGTQLLAFTGRNLNDDGFGPSLRRHTLILAFSLLL
ncbi:MAG: hypothetical protein WBC51_10575 [Vicinamibacterales bacterium]